VAADPVNPMLVFRELSARLPADTIVTADSGSSANWYARQLRFRGDMGGGHLPQLVPAGVFAYGTVPDREPETPGPRRLRAAGRPPAPAG